MHQAVDGCGRGHRILEDDLPLGERKVARQQHAAPLVAVGEQGEEDLHLLPVLLDVADVVDDHRVEPRQPLERARELEIPLGDQEFLDQVAARREPDPPPDPSGNPGRTSPHHRIRRKDGSLPELPGHASPLMTTVHGYPDESE